MPVQEIFVLPWLLFSRPRTNFFFHLQTLFQSFVPIAQQSGQEVVLGRLSLSTSICVSGENVTWILAVGEGADGYTVVFAHGTREGQ